MGQKEVSSLAWNVTQSLGELNLPSPPEGGDEAMWGYVQNIQGIQPNIPACTLFIDICYPFDLCYSKCWFSTDRIKQRSRV